MDSKTGTSQSLLFRLLGTLFLIYGAVVFFVICSYLVDIPHMDEWEWLTPEFMGSGWKSRWFYGFAANHREVPTWFFAMLNLKWFHLNFKYQMIMNLFIYALLIFSVWKLIGKRIGNGKDPIALLFLVPFLSSLNVENHTMSEQNCIHFSLISFLWGWQFLYNYKKTSGLLLGAFLLVISFYSCASGIPGTIGGLLIFLPWAFFYHRSTKWGEALLATALIAVPGLLWFIGYKRPLHHPASVFPWQPDFVKGLSEIVSLGFGYDQVEPVISWICLSTACSVVGISTVTLIRNRRDPDNRNHAFLLTIAVGFFSILCSIVIGRVGFGLSAMKWSRYFEYAVFLPLLCISLLGCGRRAEWYVTLPICCLLLLGGVGNFTFSRYRDTFIQRLTNKKCIVELMQRPENNPSGICRGTLPYSIAERVRLAQQLQVNFTRAPRLKLPWL